MQNAKICLGVVYVVLLVCFSASIYLKEYALSGMTLVAIMMSYFYGGILDKAEKYNKARLLAEKDETFADELMHHMWSHERLEEKYTNGIIEYFSRSTLFDFTSYYRNFTCSEVQDIDGTDWTFIKYCPYNHPGLYIPVFVKDLDLFTVSNNKDVDKTISLLKSWPAYKEQQDANTDIDTADLIEEIEYVADFIVKAYHKR